MSQYHDEILFTCETWEGPYDDAGGTVFMRTTPSLYLIHPDGSKLRKVTEHAGASGKFSPDGEWVYFQSSVEGMSHIYRCRTDGSELSNLTHTHTLGMRSYGFALSWDGARVCFSSQGPDAVRVAVMQADGSEPRLVAPDLGYHYMATFSPDGNTLAFACPLPDGYQLMRCDLDGGNRRWLTPDLPHSFNPRFTPDGNTILFYNRDGELYRMDADGGQLRRLTTGNDHIDFHMSKTDAHGRSDLPSISPDGSRVAWVGRVDGITQVFVMELNGSEQYFITHRPTPCAWPSWSPDGTRISFVSFVENYPQLFVIDATGGEPRQITAMDGAVYWNFWKPRPTSSV